MLEPTFGKGTKDTLFPIGHRNVGAAGLRFNHSLVTARRSSTEHSPDATTHVFSSGDHLLVGSLDATVEQFNSQAFFFTCLNITS